MVSMNRLTTEKRAQIIGCLVEGNSIRATVRMTGAAKNTITKLLVDLGEACAEYQDGVLVDLPCKVVEADEIWAFCYAKKKNVPEQFKGTSGYGDVWTFTAICADTKLVPTWLVGERTLGRRRRLHDATSPAGWPNRIQLTTDGHRMYEATVGPAFGQQHRLRADREDLRPRPTSRRKYSPAVCIGTKRRVREGRPGPGPDLDELRRAAEPDDADGDAALHAADQRLQPEGREPRARGLACTSCTTTSPGPHTALKERYPRTPAMAAGVTDHVWSLEEIAALLDG